MKVKLEHTTHRSDKKCLGISSLLPEPLSDILPATTTKKQQSATNPHSPQQTRYVQREQKKNGKPDTPKLSKYLVRYHIGHRYMFDTSQ
jgi:Tfp pilus assembly protein PilP